MGLGFVQHAPPGASCLRVHHLADDTLPGIPLLLGHGLHGLDAGLLFIRQHWKGRWQGGSGWASGRRPSQAYAPGCTVPGPSSSSWADLCHWSSEGPGRASACCTFAFSLPFFFSFFFFFFFFFLFLSFCFPRFFRPSLEEEEEEEEEEELEELEEEEEELDRGLLRALCLLLSVMQGEGEAGGPGGDEVNLYLPTLACGRLRWTTEGRPPPWQGFPEQGSAPSERHRLGSTQSLSA